MRMFLFRILKTVEYLHSIINGSPYRIFTLVNNVSQEKLKLNDCQILKSFNRLRNLFPVNEKLLVKKILNYSPSTVKRINKFSESIVQYNRVKIFNKEINLFSDYCWLRDPVTNYMLSDSLDTYQFVKNKNIDIRILWELNRLYFLPILGLGYLIDKNVKCIEIIKKITLSWIRTNPPYIGPNWLNAMEASIRASNIILTLALVHKALINDLPSHIDFIKEITNSLYIHGKFIYENIEYNNRNNHLIADFLGLLMLGYLFLKIVPSAKDWFTISYRGLLREIKYQLDDGVDYEGTIGYHAFVTELFLYSYIIMRNIYLKVPRYFQDRLSKALDFLGSIVKPNGLIPLIGDYDNSVLFDLSLKNRRDKRHLLIMGKLLSLIGTTIHQNIASELPMESLVFFPEKIQRIHEIKEIVKKKPSSGLDIRLFRGYTVMKAPDIHFILRVNKEKIFSSKGHRHCDISSYELNLCKEDIIIDPGVFTYLSSIKNRILYRSAPMHNMTLINGFEPCYYEKKYFSPLYYINATYSPMIRKTTNKFSIYFGYYDRRLKTRIMRAFIYKPAIKEFSIVDKLYQLDLSARTVYTYFHLAPSIKIEKILNIDDGTYIKLVANNNRKKEYLLKILSTNCNNTLVNIKKYSSAQNYSEKLSANLISVQWKTCKGAIVTRIRCLEN